MARPSFAAKNHDTLFRYRAALVGEIFHHRVGGVFHQNQPRNSSVNGGQIDRHHLLRREDFSWQGAQIRPLAMSTVMSSGNSGVSLQ